MWFGGRSRFSTGTEGLSRAGGSQVPGQHLQALGSTAPLGHCAGSCWHPTGYTGEAVPGLPRAALGRALPTAKPPTSLHCTQPHLAPAIIPQKLPLNIQDDARMWENRQPLPSRRNPMPSSLQPLPGWGMWTEGAVWLSQELCFFRD